ncbi:MAG: hypothetical protein GC206_13210 [Alphaproteobacteria bacterium]|nr:hypothetical protein [Alphaproteobacteria bacterium]
MTTAATEPRQFSQRELYFLASKQFNALIAAGWTPSDLIAARWTPSDLRAEGWTPSDLRAEGWTPSDLRAAGWTPSDLRAAGWTPSALSAAGWTPSALIAAGWTPSDLRAEGWTPSDLRAAGLADDQIPLIERPYTQLRDALRTKARVHKQSTWGPEDAPPAEENICKTPMCTAGHFVSMAGEKGWELKNRFGWAGAYALLHDRAHPDTPMQNTASIPDEWALAYIEEMAAMEERSPREAAAD